MPKETLTAVLRPDIFTPKGRDTFDAQVKAVKEPIKRLMPHIATRLTSQGLAVFAEALVFMSLQETIQNAPESNSAAHLIRESMKTGSPTREFSALVFKAQGRKKDNKITSFQLNSLWIDFEYKKQGELLDEIFQAKQELDALKTNESWVDAYILIQKIDQLKAMSNYPRAYALHELKEQYHITNLNPTSNQNTVFNVKDKTDTRKGQLPPPLFRSYSTSDYYKAPDYHYMAAALRVSQEREEVIILTMEKNDINKDEAIALLVSNKDLTRGELTITQSTRSALANHMVKNHFEELQYDIPLA